MGIGGPSDEFPNLSAPYPRRSILIPDRVIAGWLAGVVMKGGGYGVVVDIILGIVGGFVGGWLFGLLGIPHFGGIIGSIVVAFIGAVILVWNTRLVKKAA